MARSGLAGRLGRIREGKKNQASPAEVSLVRDEPSPLRGWDSSAPNLFERVTFHDCLGYRDSLSSYLPLLFPRERDRLAGLLGKDDFAGRLVFFDLETTGLSHGAGTVAFMASVGKFESGHAAGRLTVTQLLLRDYPGESAFLQRFIDLVGDDPTLVSFNGKCFDSQILANRFLMNGMRPALMSPDTVHLDLLFPSRRLWKETLGSCRLSAIEGGILGAARDDDLPGSEAPDAWFDYLREGLTDRLLKVGDHNRDDCVSLAKILFALDEAMENASGRAALIRAIALRADRDYESSAELLGPLAAAGDRTALRLLAIDSEHRLDDLECALSCARALGDEARATRVAGKIERSDIGGALP